MTNGYSIKSSKANIRSTDSTARLICLIFGLMLASETTANNSKSNSYLEAYGQANKLLIDANQFEKQAKQYLLLANQTRQEISRARVKVRKENQPDQKNILANKAKELSILLESQQADGANYRLNARSTMDKSLTLFEQGLSEKMGEWVTNREPLTMDKETLDYISHNASVRSVHPTMLNKMGVERAAEDSEAKVEQDNEMTLKVAALMGQSAPADLNIAAFRISNNQKYFAHIEVHQNNNHIQQKSPDGNSASYQKQLTNISQVPLNQMHQWRLVITDINGMPLTKASINVAGHMPGHVHGLPTQPQVTGEIADGVYLVEGIKFQMQGWWVIQFEVKSASESESEQIKSNMDTLTFNLIL